MTGDRPEACLGMLRFTSRKTRDLWTAVGYREDGSRHFFRMAETIGISTVESKSNANSSIFLPMYKLKHPKTYFQCFQ